MAKRWGWVLLIPTTLWATLAYPQGRIHFGSITGLNPCDEPQSLSLNVGKFLAGCLIAILLCRQAGFWRIRGNDVRWLLLLGVPVAVAMFWLPIHVSLQLNLLLFFLLNLVAVAFPEELFFRRLLQDRLFGRLSPLLAVAVTTAVFTLLHVPTSLDWAIMVTVGGFVYGVIYWQTRSLALVMIAHALLNTLHAAIFTYPFGSCAVL